MKKIEIKNLTHIFEKLNGEKIVALNNVSLKIPIGKVTVIIGPTAGGKTTLLKHFNALLLPFSGTIQIDDFLISSNKKKIKKINELRKNIGFLFQLPERQLFETSVEKDIIFGPINFGMSIENAKKSARKALKNLNLDPSFLPRLPLELSGGEKRKIAIAGVISYGPKLILIDQLGQGLDKVSHDNFLQLISTWNKKEGKTIICTGHNMDAVWEIADQIIYLKNGKIELNIPAIDLFWNNELCQKWEIAQPNRIKFLQAYAKAGGVIENLKSRTNAELINSLVAQLKNKK